MTGLLVKDLAILKQRKQQVFIFLGVMVLMGFSFDGLGLVGYGTMLLSIFTIGTLSYDEHDNCMPFLLSLPVAKKDYVTEKFLLCIGGVVFGWLISLVIAVVISLVRGQGFELMNYIFEAIAIIPVFAAVVAFMIPAQIKYGAEKSRLIMVMAAGAMFAVIATGGNLTGISTDTLDKALGGLSDIVILLGFVVVGAVLILFAYQLALRIIAKKEF